MAKPLRFAADEMLGRLAKWLRLLGQDVDYRSHWEDASLLRRCVDDPGRILLTRDTRLMFTRPIARSQIRALLLESDGLSEQLDQVAISTDLRVLPSRCGVCNGSLLPVPKAEVESRVPEYVFRTQRSFRQCSRCGRLYWRATHWEAIGRTRQDLRKKEQSAWEENPGSGRI